MKPFDLEEALAGKPVELADGNKAYVKFKVDDEYTKSNKAANPHILIGFICGERDEYERECSWSINGKYFHGMESQSDIVGMWEEPRPRVQLELPCPLKVWVEGCYLIDDDFKIKRSTNGWYRKQLAEGRYFATEEDAQEWLNAMKNNRA